MKYPFCILVGETLYHIHNIPLSRVYVNKVALYDSPKYVLTTKSSETQDQVYPASLKASSNASCDVVSNPVTSTFPVSLAAFRE